MHFLNLSSKVVRIIQKCFYMNTYCTKVLQYDKTHLSKNCGYIPEGNGNENETCFDFCINNSMITIQTCSF